MKATEVVQGPIVARQASRTRRSSPDGSFSSA